MFTPKKTACAVITVALLGSLALPVAAQAAPLSGAASTRDTCPPPAKPGDPGSESTDPDGKIDSVSISGAPASRVAHVVASGIKSNSSFNVVSWLAACASLPDFFYSGSSTSDGHATFDIPIVAGKSNFMHLDSPGPTGFGATLAFFIDDTDGGDTSPPEIPKSVGTPLVSKTTISGTTTKTATFDLTGGHEGDTVFATDSAGNATSPQATFTAAGTATVTFPITAGGITPVEFHVFPKAGQGSIAFVFFSVVNDTVSSAYAPRLSALTFTDNPRRAHITLDGLEPRTPVSISGPKPTVTATSTDDGRATLDVLLLTGFNTLTVTTSSPSGAMTSPLQLDSAQDSTPTPPPPAPAPEAPGVTVTEAGGTSTLALTGTGSAPVTVRDSSNKVVAGTVLTQGVGLITLPTPRNETRLTVTQVVAGATSKLATATLAAGVGQLTPVSTKTIATRPGAGALLTISGEAGAVVEVQDVAGTIVARKVVGTSNSVQVTVQGSAGNRFTVTQSRGGVRSANEVVVLP